MKAVRSCFCQMLAFLGRDMMLFASCLTPIIAGLFFRFGIPLLEAVLTKRLHMPAVLSPYYGLIDVIFAMLSPAMFCFAAAMVVLEETDEKTAAYFFVTPLERRGYLAARLGIPAAAAFLATVVLLPLFQLTARSPAAVLLFAAGGTLQGVITSLLILAFSSNKLEGMAMAKLSTLTVFGAAGPFAPFFTGGLQYILSPLPSFWLGKAVCENRLLYLLPAFILFALWICALLPRAMCRADGERCAGRFSRQV